MEHKIEIRKNFEERSEMAKSASCYESNWRGGNIGTNRSH